jgi:hypothetical protein
MSEFKPGIGKHDHWSAKSIFRNAVIFGQLSARAGRIRLRRLAVPLESKLTAWAAG